ncbi:MAG TPA: GNAT family N-acetyltransferase [Salinivirgaceae bacterium]|nr:GNAT family N-acetyltransferase [Salinivirgaceae bacterium]
MDDIQIRNHLVESDVERLPLLTQETQFFNYEEVMIVDELVKHTLHQNSDDYQWIVIEKNQTPIGFTCYGKIPGSEHSYDLYWIVVAKSQQSKGLGKRLIELTEIEVKKQNGAMLIAETSGKPLYEPTRNFYLRCGFIHEATIRHFYAQNDDKYFYVKRL